MDLKKQSKQARDLVKELNDVIKALEGQGCDVKVQVNSPYNKIDFVIIKKTTEY